MSLNINFLRFSNPTIFIKSIFIFLLIHFFHSSYSFAQSTSMSMLHDSTYDAAKFPGGEDSLYKFLSRNLNYPKSAIDLKIQGTVVCTFNISMEGKISNIKITRGVSKDLDNEAIRLIQSMPNWIPSKDKNIPIESNFTLPLIFELLSDAYESGSDSPFHLR